MELEKKNWILIFGTIKKFHSSRTDICILFLRSNETSVFDGIHWQKKKKKKKTSTLFPISNNIWKD